MFHRLDLCICDMFVDGILPSEKRRLINGTAFRIIIIGLMRRASRRLTAGRKPNRTVGIYKSKQVRKHGEVIAIVRERGQPIRKGTTRTRGLTATKIRASIISSSTCPLHRSFRLVVGWHFARGHPLAFQVPIRHRPRSLAGATFSRGVGRGGARS